MRAATLSAALIVAACARTPTGDWDVATIPQEELEWQSAQAASARFGHFVVDEGALGEHVSELGARLAAHSAEPERPFVFKILKTPVPYASGVPDGEIYLSRGLLALLGSDDELAWVLGHEIGHVTARHARSQISKEQLLGAAFSPLFGAVPPLGIAMAGLVEQGFSRADELEADDLGVRMASAAGLDPACALRVMRLLQRQGDATHRSDGGGWFDSHPGWDERYERQAEAGAPAAACASPAYMERLVGLRLDSDDGVYEDAAGDLILPGVGARITGAVQAKLEVRFISSDKALVRDRQREIWLTVAEQPGALIGAHIEAGPRKLDKRSEQISVDEPASTGRPTLRWIVLRSLPSGSWRDYRQWIDAGDTTFFVYSQYRDRQHEEKEAELPALVDRIQSLPAASADEVALVRRLALHTVAPGETLETIAAHYGTWSVELLAVYNDLPSGAPLAPGMQLKVVEREPLAAQRD